MADSRPDIPQPMRRQVFVEAGHRCSIPTCRAHPLEIAHIVPWAKVKKHEPQNLIALCPTCHTRYDRGEIDRQSMLIYKRQNQLLVQNQAELNLARSSSNEQLATPLPEPDPNSIGMPAALLESALSKRTVELGDYELVWPPHLFVEEVVRIIGGSQRVRSGDEALVLLLREAFRDDNVAEDFSGLGASRVLGDDKSWSITANAFIREIVMRVQEIPMQSSPRPYWGQSRGGVQSSGEPDMAKARNRFAALVSDLSQRGYLSQAFPEPCVDDHGEDFNADPNSEIERRIGMRNAWPLDPNSWNEDTFFAIMEVFHDLVSRPRKAFYHSYNSCGMHYSSFATEIGRKLYRWRLNRILEEARIPYRLGDSGEAKGRLVSARVAQ
ncbi:HNH endonuclease [Actinomadura rudentiformis]|uniref:HNH endonuclease n=1 Tax=Actinomadura rudentiformis TaxID=359158 RepID=A0A6H9YVF8_9ACTN|nr:HNH endonuclease signature motif containing protein [Actinomadura rudentiformis]KAB2351059.1 HNH endonuclease [Actinomadura rudentiformis]